MSESIYLGNQGIFFALETTEQTYVAPAATAFILTEDAAYTPAMTKTDKIKVDSIDGDLIAKEQIAALWTGFTFKVPLSWPSAAPAAAAGYLAIAPILEACGFVAPAYSAGPPAKITYAEQSAMGLIKSGSLSFREKRTATTHLEKKSSGVRGSVDFEWEDGKIPRFVVDLIGSFIEMASSAAITATVGAQLTNLGDAAQVGTNGGITLGTNTLCMTKMSIKNMGRIKPEWITTSCGGRAQPARDLDSGITITCKWPNIDTEFNPDSIIGDELPLSAKILQIGASRTLTLAYPTVQVLNWKPVEIGKEKGLEITLAKTSKLSFATE